MPDGDDTERTDKVDPADAVPKNGQNGHKKDMKIEATRDSGSREKSVEDALEAFITRANTQSIDEFDGWGVSTEDAPEEVAAKSEGKGGKKKNGKLAKSGSAEMPAVNVKSEPDKTHVVAPLPPPVVAAPVAVAAPAPVQAAPIAAPVAAIVDQVSQPIIVKKGIGWPALIVAFAAGAVVVFFAVKMTIGKQNNNKSDPPAATAAPAPIAAPAADPTAVAAPAPVAAPVPTAVPAPVAEPAPVATAEPVATPEPVAVAPAPVAAPTPVVTPLPVETTPKAPKTTTAKSTSTKTTAKTTTKASSGPKGGVVDPFATKPVKKPAPAAKPKKTTKPAKGGIVDPFGQ